MPPAGWGDVPRVLQALLMLCLITQAPVLWASPVWGLEGSTPTRTGSGAALPGPPARSLSRPASFSGPLKFGRLDPSPPTSPPAAPPDVPLPLPEQQSPQQARLPTAPGSPSGIVRASSARNEPTHPDLDMDHFSMGPVLQAYFRALSLEERRREGNILSFPSPAPFVSPSTPSSRVDGSVAAGAPARAPKRTSSLKIQGRFSSSLSLPDVKRSHLDLERHSSSLPTRKSVSFAPHRPSVWHLREQEDRRTMQRYIRDFFAYLSGSVRESTASVMTRMAQDMEWKPDRSYTPADLQVHRAFAFDLNVADHVFDVVREEALFQYAEALHLEPEEVAALRADPCGSPLLSRLPNFQGLVFSRISRAPILRAGDKVRFQALHLGSRRPYQTWYEESTHPQEYRVLLLCSTCKYVQPFLWDPIEQNRDAVMVDVHRRPAFVVVEVVEAPLQVLFLRELEEVPGVSGASVGG